MTPEKVPAWLAEAIKNTPPGNPGPATREVLIVAGYGDAVVATYGPKDEEFFSEQLHGSPTWPPPDEAAALATGIEVVRRKRGEELLAARTELVAARPVVEKVERDREAQRPHWGQNKKVARDSRIVAFAAEMRADTAASGGKKVTARDVRDRLTLDPIKRGEVLGRGVSVPSEKTIARILRRHRN